MANQATTFRNTTAIAARTPEVPAADWAGGMNNASCLPGVGVATDVPNLTGDPNGWTLEDQFEVARTPQVSQVIGGNGYTPDSAYPSSGGVPGNGSDQAQFIIGVQNPDYPNAAGTVTVDGTANLVSLAAGWSLV